MTRFTEKRAQRRLQTASDKVRETDLQALLEQQQAIETKVRGSGRLQRFSTDIRLLFAMVRDYWKGRYRQVPWKTVAAAAGALLYVMNPLDAIPDLIFGLGLLDDAGVVALCLKLVESDLRRYAAWQAQQDHSREETPERS